MAWFCPMARPNTVRSFVRWLNEVAPGGGTEPKPAFELIFAQEERPDVIFFLTDGVIPDMNAEFVAGLNAHGKRVVINTISFGEDSSQGLLKQIAADSGGVWRHVRSE